MGSKQDEKNAKILRGMISDVPANRRCADCTAKGPVYVNTTFNTFVCTTCSGLHREFNHRVKSISMAVFKPDEMAGLQNGGNEVARQIYLARWTPNEFPEPDPGDPERIRHFIRLKYIDKRWVASGGNQNPGPTVAAKKSSPTTTSWQPFADKGANLPKAERLENILGNNIPPIQVNQSSHLPPHSPNFHQPTQPIQPIQPAQTQPDWATAWSNSPQTASPVQPVQQQQQVPNLFPASPPAVHAPTLTPSTDQSQRVFQETQVSTKANSLQSQLGQLYQQSAQQQAQQQMMQQQQMQQQMMQQQQQMFMQQQQQLQMMMQQMAAANGGQLTPQQMQQVMMMQQQMMMGQQQGGVPQQMNPQQQNPAFNGMPQSTSVTPAQSWVVEEQKPVEPAKPDPFASLSPFSMGGAPVKSSGAPRAAPILSTPQVVQHNANPFGDDLMGGFSNPPPASSTTTSFGGTSDPGNPFF
eukprot:TRINITY_DN299_c0_g1_i1.p1 TRINITY_DN299_c0_g1~~TRINITY_DN299_c0_g1_i1.p1  ORF type:complete len:468 (-),score=143.26 TRINITY_DN299_c0_g1_i1:106-1509(-)